MSKVAIVACLLQMCGVVGPLSYEFGEAGVLRQEHEDGRERAKDESCPGIGLSGDHTRLMNDLKKKWTLPISHIVVTGDAASGGSMKLYLFKGENVQTFSAAFVGLVLYSYIWRFDKDRDRWHRWSEISRRFNWPWQDWEHRAWVDEYVERREALERLDGIFGPNSPMGRK